MKLFFLFIALLFLSGCATKKIHKVEIHKIQASRLPSYKLKNKTPISLAIYDEYLKWYATPYLFGGSTFKGTDCSYLVQSIYRDAFRIHIPRTTKEQAKFGRWIAKNRLRAGDLVLFKTGYNSRHSGVYLENGNFINSSSKHGVSLANIHNPYWKSKYWQSRRVLP